ncbi:MAG: DUF3822 family protein [Muribaculaceae bacterium]|nr:DUF3822 family protein [Muribaculaceae bacterium]
MTSTRLTKELINDATPMRLILRVTPQSLSALIVGPESIDPTVIAHSEELPDASVKALENAVYDNPLLLSDFDAIDIIFATREFFLFPESAADLLDDMAAAMLPDIASPRETLMQQIPGPNPAVGFAVDADRLNFLRRTFSCARFHHSLAVASSRLIGHAAGFYALGNAPGDMMLLSVNPDSTLRYLNAPEAFGANDCAYHILAAADTGEPITLMCADPELQAAITDIITKVKPSSNILAPELPEALLNLRRMAPETAFDALFLTSL